MQVSRVAMDIEHSMQQPATSSNRLDSSVEIPVQQQQPATSSSTQPNWSGKLSQDDMQNVVVQPGPQSSTAGGQPSYVEAQVSSNSVPEKQVRKSKIYY